MRSVPTPDPLGVLVLNAPHAPGADPFAATVRGLDEPDPVHAALRAAGPLVQVDAPAGGQVWIVTEEALAREVLAHPLIAKDPAYAPADWDRYAAGLEPTAAEQPSLTTLDGPAHAALRRAHAPLFSARRIRERSDRVHAVARSLLGEQAARGTTVDLMADFTTRYPLTVLLDLLGIPLHHVDGAADACRRMLSYDAREQGGAMADLARIASAGLDGDEPGLAAALRDRLPADAPRDEVGYHLFALVFAGQLTTDAALGMVVARALAGAGAPDGGASGPGTPVEELVRETLGQHPPAPLTLWRFTTGPVELAGTVLPARAPVLVDIQGINAGSSRGGADLTFGAGPHFCIGAQLAQLELGAVVRVLREDFPGARLAVPFGDLRQGRIGGLLGSRVTALPVTFT
ncbi:cytochrome P450 [Streptomyces uncialis]|uniref:cytochrome P450 n=1 Tax=Streptomyces uncialis TaxID=1048205 RepID=UPI0037B6465B